MDRTLLSKFRNQSWRTTIVFTLVLIGLSILSAWNLSRSNALPEARGAYTRGDLAASLEHALDHLGRQPWSQEAALLAARCLSRLDYAEHAEPYYRRAGQLELNDAQVRAYGLARGPHPEHSIPAYNEILVRWPDNVTALRRLAAIQLAQNNSDELLKLADRLGRIPNGAVIGQTLRGVVYHNDKNPQQAVAAFERVLDLDPELREMPLVRGLFWSHLADDLIECGRFEDAGRYLTQALVDNNDASLMNRLGRVYFLQGSLIEAERCFRQVAEWDPSDYSSRLELAKLALQRRARAEALLHLNQAHLLAPRHYSVLYSLASVYRQLGRTFDADRIQETINQLVRDKPSSSPHPTNSPWPRYAL
jgi:tetratricopeptide (TPR) repeat protein